MSLPEPAVRGTARYQPGLGVALGGGGMKGWAHVGVLAELERLGLRPGVVAGTSAGALIGAYYAAGYSIEEMKRFMREQRTAALFSLRFDGQGLLSTESFHAYLADHLRDCTFADLEVPFYVIATDLRTGKEVVLREGSVVQAVLASSAIPGIFAPVEVGGRLLVDGGLCNNVPVSPLVGHGVRFTLAVRLHPEADPLPGEPPSPAAPDPEATRRVVSLSMWTERLRRTFRGAPGNVPNGFEVIGRALEIVMGQLAGYRLQAHPPDVLLTPDVGHVGMLSFSEEKEEIFSGGVRAVQREAGRLRRLSALLAAG